MAHKLKGKDWQSTILVVGVVAGTVTIEDDGFIDIEDITDEGEIKKCSHHGGAGEAFDLEGKADDNTVKLPKVELHRKGASRPENPRYTGQLMFESDDGKTKIIVGSVLRSVGQRKATQQEDTWVATKH